MWKAFALIALLDGTPLAALADDATPPPPRHHHQIPAEAFDACKNLEEGKACTVAFHDQKHDGICHKAHDDGRLFCMPPHPAGEHHPPGPPAAPPPAPPQ